MQTIYARAHGMLPDAGTDCAPLARRMLETLSGDCEIVFESGRYDFYPEQAARMACVLCNSTQTDALSIGLLLAHKRGVILSGRDTTFILHGQITPIAVVDSEDVRIRGIRMDWAVPLVSEGTVVDAHATHVDVRIDQSAYPHAVEDGRLFFLGENWKAAYWGAMAFDTASGITAYRAGDRFRSKRQEALAPGLIRFHGAFDPVPQAGNTLVLRHGERIHPGILLHQSARIAVADVTIHQTGGLGILGQYCTDLSFENVQFRPNPAAGRRILSGRDDGLHLANNAGHILIDRCFFAGLMDDPVNVHGTSLRIERVLDERLVEASFVHEQAPASPCWAKAGDRLRLIDAQTMAERGQAVAASYAVHKDGVCRIAFEENLPATLAAGDALENLSNTPSLTVRNSCFGSCRARGILVTTPKPVHIEHNVFASSGAAILLAGDANGWYESGACEDVTIRGNCFTEHCLVSAYQFCEAIISLCPEIPAPSLEKPFHRNIRIEDNTFHAFDAPLLYAFSAKNIVFAGNRIMRGYAHDPWHHNRQMVTLSFCDGVRIADNALAGDVLGPSVRTAHTRGLVSDLPVAGA